MFPVVVCIDQCNALCAILLVLCRTVIRAMFMGRCLVTFLRQHICNTRQHVILEQQPPFIVETLPAISR